MPPKRVTPRGQAAPTPQPVVAAPAAPKKRQPAAKKAAPKAKTYFVRNIRGTQCRCTLFDGTRIFLEPRGQRGDLHPVLEEHLDDPILMQNIGMLFEVIDGELGREILMKQHSNQTVGPTAFDQLVNEKGESLKVNRNPTPSFEAQGQTVAHIQAGADTRYSENNTDLVRAPGYAPPLANVPGTQVTAAEYADFLARQSSEQAAEVLREQFRVSVDPPERMD